MNSFSFTITIRSHDVPYSEGTLVLRPARDKEIVVAGIRKTADGMEISGDGWHTFSHDWVTFLRREYPTVPLEYHEG